MTVREFRDSPCQTCGGTGKVDRGNGTTKPCHCAAGIREAARIRELRRAREVQRARSARV